MLCTVEPDVDLAELEARWDVAVPTQGRRSRGVDRENLDEVVTAAVAGNEGAADDLLAFLRPIVVRY